MSPEQHKILLSLANHAHLHLCNMTGDGRKEMKEQERMRAELALQELIARLMELRP